MPPPTKFALRLFPKPGADAARQLVNASVLLILVAVLTMLSDTFLAPSTIADVLRQVATVVTVGGFFTLLMVAGGIDLSVGAVVALSGIVSVSLVNAGVPVPIAFVAATAFGALVGSVNGFLVAILGVNSVIATLGTMYVTRGISLVSGEGRAIRAQDPEYAYLGNGSIGPVPLIVIVMVIALAIAIVLERRTLVGRYAVLVGSNIRGARLSGVPARSTLVALFVLTGAAAGWAGVMVSSRLGSAVSKVGVGFEFDVIIAALLGGTSLLGGEGSIVGLLLGALIVGTATSGMNILGVETFVQRVLLGVVLLAAVGLDAVVRARRNRPARRTAVQAE